MTRFAVLVLCPGATFSDLLMESRKHDVTVLEIIPFSAAPPDYERYLTAATPNPVLFVLGSNNSVLVEQAGDLHQALDACCAAS